MILYFGQKTKMKTVTKRIKPIDIDTQLIYQCPTCGLQHWATLKETQTPNYIIVCDCGSTLRLKTINNINIEYVSKKKKDTHIKIIDQCTDVLCQYGFNKQEARQWVVKAHQTLDENNRSVSQIIKLSLKLFGENNA